MNIAAGSPPRTLVEEDPDLELPSDFSESKMFTLLDNWDPPTCFVAAEALPRFTGVPGPCATQSGEHDTCVVEEDPLNSPIGLKVDK